MKLSKKARAALLILDPDPLRWDFLRDHGIRAGALEELAQKGLAEFNPTTFGANRQWRLTPAGEKEKET